jgi:Fic family protein
MSAQIRRERSEYYRVLEGVQKGSLNITSWQKWFLSCLRRAIEGSQDTLRSTSYSLVLDDPK